MYKLMLADDEGIVRESLKFIVDKEFPGSFETFEAKTGRRVIELADEVRPDIAFMDIRMPGINGIDAMKEIRTTNPNIVFVVISAYDKFDYAKQALNLGVIDYINKPFDKAQIVAVLKKAMAEVDRVREQRSRELEVKEKLESIVPIIENGLIQDLLSHEHYKENIDEYKKLLEIDEKYGLMLAIVSGDKESGGYLRGAVPASVKTQKNYETILLIISDNFKCITGSDRISRLLDLIVEIQLYRISYFVIKNVSNSYTLNPLSIQINIFVNRSSENIGIITKALLILIPAVKSIATPGRFGRFTDAVTLFDIYSSIRVQRSSLTIRIECNRIHRVDRKLCGCCSYAVALTCNSYCCFTRFNIIRVCNRIVVGIQFFTLISNRNGRLPCCSVVSDDIVPKSYINFACEISRRDSKRNFAGYCSVVIRILIRFLDLCIQIICACIKVSHCFGQISRADLIDKAIISTCFIRIY